MRHSWPFWRDSTVFTKIQCFVCSHRSQDGMMKSLPIETTVTHWTAQSSDSHVPSLAVWPMQGWHSWQSVATLVLCAKHVLCTSAGHDTGGVPIHHMGLTDVTYGWTISFDTRVWKINNEPCEERHFQYRHNYYYVCMVSLIQKRLQKCCDQIAKQMLHTTW